ncbi:MAG TPA: HAD-IB family phosphatase [Nitrososphaerales archaeon]|nr:HAD-IB family phosphatase [Nitrososphaerales archaeon]
MDRRKEGFLLAAFDMDGTLLEEDSSWAAIHRHFGTTESSRISLDLYTRGRIDYREFMKRDIASWPKGLTRPDIERILYRYRMRREAREVVSELRKRGMDVAVVTSGIDILAEHVARSLGIERWLANGLRFDRDGVLMAKGIGRVDPRRKDLAYLRMLRRLGIDSKRTIAVGDTIYDLEFLRSAGRGFMLAHTTRVDSPEIIHIEKLTDIFHHI